MKNTLYVIVAIIVIVISSEFVYSNLKSVPVPETVVPSATHTISVPLTSPTSSTQKNSGSSTATNAPHTPTPVTIGGNKDSHGCALGGGYSWDIEMGKCVRPWEKLSTLVPSKRWYLVNSDGSISNTIYFETNTDGTKVSGKVCNSFSGSVKIDDKTSSVYISKVASTMMACTDKVLSTAESVFFAVANGVVQVKLNEDNSHITLSGPVAGTTINIEFAPKDR